MFAFKSKSMPVLDATRIRIKNRDYIFIDVADVPRKQLERYIEFLSETINTYSSRQTLIDPPE